jgi:hypothetical protein
MGAGAFVGSLAGAASAMGDESAHPPTARRGGILAANAELAAQGLLVDTLVAAGARMVEVEERNWADGEWRDFDAVGAPRHVVGAKGNPDYPT